MDNINNKKANSRFSVYESGAFKEEAYRRDSSQDSVGEDISFEEDFSSLKSKTKVSN